MLQTLTGILNSHYITGPIIAPLVSIDINYVVLLFIYAVDLYCLMNISI